MVVICFKHSSERSGEENVIKALLKIIGEEITGYYGAAFRFLDASHLIPLSIMTALFPTFTKLHLSSVANLKKLYFKILAIMLIIAIPVTLVLFFGAEQIIQILYGRQYTQSANVLKILSFTTIFMFLHVPGAHLLFASEKILKKVIVLSFFTVGFNILGNLILIPKYSLIGASFMTVASEGFSFVVFYLLIWFKFFKNK